ncbi:hypothetical protein K1719_017482 [Acacia pycnantha]|nr:hypothetical protein K1719_017482 [Acacia pycnantha]
MQMLILNHPLFWPILGFVSCIVAVTCFALSPSFHYLFGSWNLLKISIYIVACVILATLTLLIKKCRRFTRSVPRKYVVFLVMMVTSLCSIWQDLVSQKDNQEDGSRGRILNMCSFGAFGLMSLSLSRQLQLGFEVGISNFFFGSLLVLLIKMNFILIPLAALFCYMFIYLRYFSDHQREMRGRVDSSDTVLLDDIESGNHSVDLQRMSKTEFNPHCFSFSFL